MPVVGGLLGLGVEDLLGLEDVRVELFLVNVGQLRTVFFRILDLEKRVHLDPALSLGKNGRPAYLLVE